MDHSPEVDSILLYTLKQIGCDVEPESTLKELSTNQIINCITKCFELIKPDLVLPQFNQQSSMSGRYKVASEIAQSISELGYTEEIGCQSFLYPTEGETRKLLIFFVEKLPSVIGETNQEVGDQIESLLTKIAQDKEFESEALSSSEGRGIIVDGIRLPDSVDVDNLPKETLKFYASHLSDLTFDKLRQTYRKAPESPTKPPPVAKPPSDDEDDEDWGDQDMPEIIPITPQAEKPKVPAKPQVPVKPKPPLRPKPSLEKKEEEEERRQAEEIAAKLKQLQELVKGKANELLERDGSMKDRNKEIREAQNELEALKKILDGKEKDLIRKQRTLELMSDSEEGLERLRKAVEGQREKIIKISNQWETHRLPLIEEMRSKKAANADKISETKKNKEEIKELKGRLKEMGREAKAKSEVYEQLLNEYEKMPKDLNRSAYTKRISEIIGNIKKQKKEITKVLNDTKFIQKEINTLTGRLDRTFAVADEIIFKDAEKDKNVAQSYKLLVAIHSDFSRVIKVIEETGNLKRQGRDIEDKLELERGKNIEGKLERLRADLGQMKKENQILSALLRDPALKKGEQG